jgi:HEAT repeat protein
MPVRLALLLAVLLGTALLGPEARAADGADLAAVRRALADDDPMARAAAVRRLAGSTDPAAVRLVSATLSDPHPHVRRAAAGVLGVAVDRATRRRVLADAAAWSDRTARADVCRAFAAWADEDGREGLLRALTDRDASVRAAASGWLGDDPEAGVGPGLLRAASDPDGLVRATALDALAARAARDRAAWVPAPFRAGLEDRDPRVRLSALEGSVARAGETAAFAVGKGLTDSVWSVRLVAAELAGTVRDRRVLPPLVAALGDPRERVVQAAGGSLVRLTGIPFEPVRSPWEAWLVGDGAAFDPAEAPPAERRRSEVVSRTAAVARFLDLPLVSSHVSFVLDASGSMAEPDTGGGTRWERVQVELGRALERLGASAEGNVVLFADGAEPVFPEAVRFTPAARARVREVLGARRPSGRTALYDGIARALEDPSVDSIVVLSDGAPSAGSYRTKSDLRAELRRANRWRRARIDVVSIGADEVARRWRPLLGEIALDHGGHLLAR